MRKSSRWPRRTGGVLCVVIAAACWTTHAARADASAPVITRLPSEARSNARPMAPPLTAERRELAALHEAALRELRAVTERLREAPDDGTRQQLQARVAEIKRAHRIRALEVLLAHARRRGNDRLVTQLESLLRGMVSPHRAPAPKAAAPKQP